MTGDLLPVATSWYSVAPLGDGVTLVTEPYIDPLLRANLFHVRGRDADLLVDAGTGVAPLRPALEGLLDPGREVIAVATHAHYDHVGCMHEFPERLVHPAEARQLAGEDVFASLLAEDFPQDWRDQAAAEGYPLPAVLVTAVPWDGYDPASYTVVPSPATGTIDEGESSRSGIARLPSCIRPATRQAASACWKRRPASSFPATPSTTTCCSTSSRDPTSPTTCARCAACASSEV